MVKPCEMKLCENCNKYYCSKRSGSFTVGDSRSSVARPFTIGDSRPSDICFMCTRLKKLKRRTKGKLETIFEDYPHR